MLGLKESMVLSSYAEEREDKGRGDSGVRNGE